jgi:hypothetical protein
MPHSCLLCLQLSRQSPGIQQQFCPQENCSEAPVEALLSEEEIADTLVDAGLVDVALIAVPREEQRDCDTLVAATGHSRQHALAGVLHATLLTMCTCGVGMTRMTGHLQPRN